MDCAEEDVELLLSLQNDDKVQETPPKSSSPTYSSGNHSDEDRPKQRGPINMGSFRMFLESSTCSSIQKTSLHQRLCPVSASCVDVEAFSGLRIKNRLVSAVSLSSKFSDLRFIRLQAMKNVMNGDKIGGAWATIGVLAEKAKPKLSSNGKNYVVWKLTALDGNLTSVFIFGSAYTCHWKESAGNIIALFNANVRQDAKKKDFTLSVFGGDQVLLLGTAADFGVCKGKRKDGSPCTIVVNRRQGELCKFHSVASLQKYKTKRGELSGGNLATGLMAPNKIRQAQVIKAPEDVTIDEPVKRAKHLSSLDLAKALSNADKVTTRTSSQGIRCLASIAEETSNKNLEAKLSNENKGGSTRKKGLQERRTALKEKILNTNFDPTRIQVPVQMSNRQTKQGVMELDIESFDGELEQAHLLFYKA